MSESFFIGPYAIRPHPKAPLFSSPEAATASFSDLTRRLASGTPLTSSSVLDLVRQLGLVSLHFFLTTILGAPNTGPYENLQDPVSLDMCNFRQSDAVMLPGSRSAGFMPRGFYKSTILTHGGATWELVRDPELTIAIVNAIAEKALEFLRIVERNFDSNPLMKLFYPDHCAFGPHSGEVTAERLVLPNKLRRTVEPSIRTLSMTGASEGGHYDIMWIDDLAGLDSVDSSYASNANMGTSKKWFRSNQNALLKGRSSRIGVSATRYAIDDCYQDICSDVKAVVGWQKGDLQPVPNGTWTVYWRKVEEDGYYLRPDVMDKIGYEKLLREDFWSAMTLYANEPYKAGLAEFSEAKIGVCDLVWEEKDETYWIYRPDASNFEETNAVRLEDCDVIMTVDPAATNKDMKSRSCRTSIGIWACDSADRRYRIWSRVGFFSLNQMVDHIFAGNERFKGYIRNTYIETNAYQAVLKPFLDEESIERGAYIGVLGAPAKGDKKARIRSAFQSYALKGKLFATLEAGKELIEELRIFPMSENKMDVLDESEKGIVFSRRPESSEEIALRREAEEQRFAESSLNAFGY